MNVTSILSSPRGLKGYTATVLKGILEGVQRAGAETSMFSLSELSVQPCRGCETCSRTGQCVINDDYQSIREAILEADGFILASPNYMHGVTSQMKAFIDRSYSLCHCQALKGKYSAAVITSGGPFMEWPEQYLTHVLEMMGCWVVGSLPVAQLQLDDTAERKHVLRSAANLGRQTVEAIRSRKVFPDQAEDRRTFFEGMRLVVELHKDKWPYEFDYWQTRWGSGK
ncbi:MAG: flavodoxin family protein [Deltaproteobacteria bacterium]|nr:flavodoxin family protein [Deltaproteobacteria bacterium]